MHQQAKTQDFFKKKVEYDHTGYFHWEHAQGDLESFFSFFLSGVATSQIPLTSRGDMRKTVTTRINGECK